MSWSNRDGICCVTLILRGEHIALSLVGNSSLAYENGSLPPLPGRSWVKHIVRFLVSVKRKNVPLLRLAGTP